MTAQAVAEKKDAPSALDALTTAVIGLDGSRRVGWAKAFEAIRQLDSASHDLNVAREDRHIYRQRLSYTYGFFVAMSKQLGTLGGEAQKQLSKVTRLDDAPLDTTEIRHGAEHANRILAAEFESVEAVAARVAEIKEREKALRRERRENDPDHQARKAAHDKMFAAAKVKALDELAAEFGFADASALRVHLEAQS